MANDLYDRLTQSLRRGRDQGTNYQTLKAELWRTVEADPDKYLQMFFHNWFNNNWARPIDETNKRRLKPKPYRPKKQQTPEEIREQRKRDANLRGIALMNVFLSDGETRIKDATGAQIRQESGWFQLIAKRVKPNEIVGKKLTAEQLFNLKVQSEPKDQAAKIGGRNANVESPAMVGRA